MPDAFSQCGQMVREADRDRFLATLFAPAPYRRPLFALYAFNVEIARVAEIVTGPMPGEIRLQWWREVLRGERDGEAAGHPVASAIREVTRHYSLPLPLLEQMIEGRIVDVYDDPIANWHALEAYAAQIGATVLLLAARILNDGRNPMIDAFAGHAGVAEGYAAIGRGLGPQAARGKLYLPSEALERVGADRASALAGRATVPVRQVVTELTARARTRLAQARELVGAVPANVIPALLPLALTKGWLDRIDRAAPFTPVEYPQWLRQWRLWRAARGGLGRAL
jgi:phytoene synthase